MRVAGDSYPRFKIRADGQIEWGPGSAATDCLIERTGVSYLETNVHFIANNNYLRSAQSNTTRAAFVASILGESDYRWRVLGDGTVQWGSGSASLDCELGRRTANILNTPDRLEVGTLGVGNSAAATTPGNVVKKIEVFDNAGNSLGFLAVYDSIS